MSCVESIEDTRCWRKTLAEYQHRAYESLETLSNAELLDETLVARRNREIDLDVLHFLVAILHLIHMMIYSFNFEY
jgi:hypothetical protein